MPKDYLAGCHVDGEISRSKVGVYLRWIKPFTDLFMVIVTLPVTVLLIAVLAILVRIDSPGPVFLRVKCRGLRGQVFAQWRFRCVYLDATLRYQRPSAEGAPDPRVTRMGRFLLRTQLNALPQIFNILTADMALVGPHAVLCTTAAAAAGPEVAVLSQLRPGLVDPSELYRAQTPEDVDATAISLAYARKASLWVDLSILVAAIFPRSFS